MTDWADEERRYSAWSQAGMTSRTGSGALQRPTGDRSWLKADDIRLEGGALVWKEQPDIPGVQPETSEGDDDLFDSFLALADSSPEEIVDFARRYGPLRVCEHTVCRHPSSYQHDRDCVLACEPEAVGRVPIPTWQHVSRKVRAVLTLAAALHDGHDIDRADWNELLPDEGIVVQLRPMNVGLIVDGWLSDTTRFGFDWGPDAEPELRLETRGLWGAIVLDTALAIARSDGLAMCSACKRPYAPTRKPPAGRRNYCPACRGSADQRDAARAYRQRTKTEEK